MEENNVGTHTKSDLLVKSFEGELGRQVIGFKAARRVGVYLEIPGLGEREINLLSALYLWGNVMNKGGGLERFINWTGYSSSWKRQMYGSAERCMKWGLLEEKSVKGGKRIVVNTQGYKVLEFYWSLLESVRLEELGKAVQGKERLKAVA